MPELTPQDALNNAYTERAHLVAALSKLFPAHLEVDTTEPDWPVCMIQLPTGQASWHISPTDLHLYAHLPRHHSTTWDGHTTPEKYKRLDALTTQHGWQGGYDTAAAEDAPDPTATLHELLQKTRPTPNR